MLLIPKRFLFLGTFEIAVLCIQFSKNNSGFTIPGARSSKLKKNLFFIFQLLALYFGGGERDRTDDLLRAKQVLSQLSYTPNGLSISNC